MSKKEITNVEEEIVRLMYSMYSLWVLNEAPPLPLRVMTGRELLWKRVHSLILELPQAVALTSQYRYIREYKGFIDKEKG